MGARIAQTVVTDPSEGRASGYVLVAASPGVLPQDARHLTAAPQVTDYLHLETSPGPFLGFYRLPSGAWAAAKRFVRGKRRGDFNRVVVHTLVLSAEALDAVAVEPWLLWTRCRFRPVEPGGELLSPAELSDRAGEPGLEHLRDVEVVLENAREARCSLLERRRDFLLERWGEERLHAGIEAILAARAAGRKALLPQGDEHEQLLAVVWSMLPAADRLETAWTSHLGAAAGALFHLACCPDPAAFAGQQDDREPWVAVLRESGLQGVRGEVEDVRALAGALSGSELDLRQLDDGLRRFEVRLAERGRVRRYIAWLRRGGPSSLDGLASAGDLYRFFHDLRRRPDDRQVDPWLAAPALLACACATVKRLVGEGEEPASAVAEVLRVLEETHWRAALLDLDVVAALSETEAALLPVAVAFALDGLAPPPAGRGERESLADLLLDAPQTEDPLFCEALASLAVDLTLTDSKRAGEAFARLAELPEGLVAASRRLEAKKAHLRPIRAVLRAATKPHGRSAAARAVAGLLSKLLTAEPALIDGLPASELRSALALLEGLAPEENGILFGRVLDALRQCLPPLIPPRGQSLPPREQRLPAKKPTAPEGTASFRALMETFRSGVEAHAERAVAVLAGLAELPSKDFLDWDETVAGLADALDSSAPEAASLLRANYWQQLFSRRAEKPRTAALRMLSGLGRDDRRRVAELWLPMTLHLKSGSGADELMTALGTLVDPADEEQRYHYNIGRLRLDLAGGHLDLVAAVAAAGASLQHGSSGTSGLFMRRALQKLLPVKDEARARAIVDLLLAREILPSIKRLLERDFVETALRRIGPSWAPQVRELLGRSPLLLRVAARVGTAWGDDAAKARRFLREAVTLERFDAAAAFLRAAEGRRPGFLVAAVDEGDHGLVRKVLQAAENHPRARPYLWPYLAVLRTAAASGRSRR